MSNLNYDLDEIENVAMEAAHVPAHIAAPKSGRANIGGGYWQRVWKILGITMFWGAILAIVLAAIVCSNDFIWRL